MIRSVLIFGTLQFFFLSGPAIAEQDLHFIIVSDHNDPELGEGFRINTNIMANLLIDHVATRNLKITEVCRSTANGWTPLTTDMVLNAIRTVPVDADDTLIVYLACHGYFDPKVGNFFAFAGQRAGFSRKSIIDAINARRPRLGGIISDACQEYQRMELPSTAQSPVGPPLEFTDPLLQSLFFEHSGFLDWSAASEGEFAVYYNNYRDLLKAGPNAIRNAKKNWAMKSRQGPKPYKWGVEFLRINGVEAKGGLFTEALVSVADDNLRNKLDWNQFHALVKQKTNAEYQKEVPNGMIDVAGFERHQPAQTVVLTKVPVRTNTPGGEKPPMKPIPPDNDNPRLTPPSMAFGVTQVLFTNSTSQPHSVTIFDAAGRAVGKMEMPPESAWVTFVSDRQKWSAVAQDSSETVMGRIGVNQPTVTFGRGATGRNSYGAVCYQRAGGDGVVVVQLVGNSQADRDGLRTGDILSVVNGVKVNNAASYNTALGQAGGRVGVIAQRGQTARNGDGTVRLQWQEKQLGARMSGGGRPTTPIPPGTDNPPTTSKEPDGDLQLTVVNTGNVVATVRTYDTAGTVIGEQKVAPGTVAIAYGRRGQKWEVTAIGSPAHGASFQAKRYYHQVGGPPAIENRLGAYVLPQVGTERLVIAHVREGSTAFEYQFTPGDIVVSVNGQDVSDAASYEKAVRESGAFLRIVLERPRVVTLQANGKSIAVGEQIEATVQLQN